MEAAARVKVNRVKPVTPKSVVEFNGPNGPTHGYVVEVDVVDSTVVVELTRPRDGKLREIVSVSDIIRVY
jgi:hypothetical protein